MSDLPKLVRNDIPARIDREGGEVRTRQAENIQPLIEKLSEEVQEYQDEAEIEELADVYEVIRALAQIRHGGLHRVAQEAADKRREYGGFENGTILVEVDE